MKKIIGFIAPIAFALLIIIACKKEETKVCPPPANTFTAVYNDSLLTINFAVNDQGLTEVELGEVGFLPGTGLRTTGTTVVVYPAIPRSKEYQYYVRTDCGDGNYSYWVGPLDLNTFCYGEATDYTSTVQDSSVTIIWNNAPKLVEIEYGLEGFARGTGNFTNSDLESLTINKLSNGRYSFYGRSVCDDDSYGPWRGPYMFEITGSTNIACDGTFKQAPYSINLLTQNELDAFGEQCYTYASSLTLEGSGIKDIGPLASLTTIDTLIIAYTDITSLYGLANTEVIGVLDLFGNPIETLSGLDNLTSLSNVRIRDNQNLSDYCAISHLFPGPSFFIATANAFDPSEQDMIDGNCKP